MTAAACQPPAAVDARRYAWCRTQAVWSFGVVLPMLAEDVDGARDAGQAELLRYVARLIAEYCATALYLVQAYPRPLPPTSVRAIVAIRAVPDGSVRALFEDLIDHQDSDLGTLAERCHQAISRTTDILGPVPQLINRSERHRAVGHARDWLGFISQVGEGDGDYLPDVPARSEPSPGRPTPP